MRVRAKHGHWQGKVVFITGAAQGIGRATALVSPTAATVDTYPRSLPSPEMSVTTLLYRTFIILTIHWNNCYLLVYVYILLSLFLASSDQKRFLVLASLHVYLDVFEVDTSLALASSAQTLNSMSSVVGCGRSLQNQLALSQHCSLSARQLCPSPEAVIRGVGVSAFSVTEIVISNE